MGSGKTTKLIMADEKKSILNRCKNAFKWLRKGKSKEAKEQTDTKNAKTEEVTIIQPVKPTPVAVLLDREIEKKKQQENEEEDEFKNFSYKVIEEEPRQCRIDSESSVDSGFAEKAEDDKESEELADKLKDLKVDTKETKEEKKKLQTVVITRGPVKSWNESLHPKSHPYGQKSVDEFRQSNTTRQIQSQINKQTLSGGHVIVNDSKAENLALAAAFDVVEQRVRSFSTKPKDEQDLLLEVGNEFVDDELHVMGSLDSYPTMSLMGDEFHSFATSPNEVPLVTPQPNLNYDLLNQNYEVTLSELNYFNDDCQYNIEKSIFLTPPRSEDVSSPRLSDSPCNTILSDYTMSPQTSSPMRSELEVYQALEELPFAEVQELETQKPKKRKERTSNPLKYYKDLQKEISGKFSKKNCCQMNRRGCNEIFKEHMQKLKKEDRANICLKVAKLGQKEYYVALCYIIVKLAESSLEEDLQLSLFTLICEKVLAQKPELFLEDFGLGLIKLAVFRCYTRPLLTRYLVQCVRTALKITGKRSDDAKCVYQEVDMHGDNVLHACVRQGDAYADVLSELVRKDPADLPLFDVHHHNSDGFLPLHIACSIHSSSSPRLHLAHVLLEHARADLWRWDLKGGETALHLALNSATCDLLLIMVLFRHVERKEWRRLAHYPNRSSVKCVDYARNATRSSSRSAYPREVVEFLHKCR